MRTSAAPGEGMLNAWAFRMRPDASPGTFAEAAQDLEFPGLATGKGVAHAMMLQCLLQLRSSTAVRSQPAGGQQDKNSVGSETAERTSGAFKSPSGPDTIMQRREGEARNMRSHEASRVETEGFQPMHEPERSVDSSGDKRAQHRRGARDAHLPVQIFRNVPALLQDMVLCAAEACAAAYMDDVRSGSLPTLQTRTQGTPGDDAAYQRARWPPPQVCHAALPPHQFPPFQESGYVQLEEGSLNLQCAI